MKTSIMFLSTYLQSLPTNLCLPAFIYLPIHIYLPMSTTDLCLLTYLPLPLSQYIIATDPGAGIGIINLLFFPRGEIRLSDSLGFLVMYVVYLSVVLVGRFVHQRMRRRLLAEALLYQVRPKSSSKVEQMGVCYSCLHAFIHWRHKGAGLKISSIYVMAALSALCKPHSASEQKLSAPIHSNLLDDFEVRLPTCHKRQ